MLANSYVTNALPSRTNPTRRNLTGLYLGIEGGRDPPRPRTLVNTMARGRGLPSRRSKTPVERHSQNKVDHMREKDESYVPKQLGLTGKQPNKAKLIPMVESPDYENYGQYPISFYDITRETDRKYTAVTNNGVIRFENLNQTTINTSDSPHNLERCPSVFATTTPDLLTSQVEHNAENMLGLSECYSKICKGRPNTLSSLLTKRHHSNNTAKQDSNNKYTGFEVKSYRKPNAADIVASFPTAGARNRIKVNTRSRVQYTSHYFKYFGTPNNMMGTSNGRDQTCNAHNVNGVRLLGRTAHGVAPKGLHNQIEHQHNIQQRILDENIRRPQNTPCTEQIGNRRLSKQIAPLQEKDNTDMIASPINPSNLKMQRPSVVIGLENEAGISVPIDNSVQISTEIKIHQDSEVCDDIKNMSVTDNKISEEKQIQILEEDAKTRKEELATLLDEHASLVEHVTILTSNRDSDDAQSNKEDKIPPMEV